MEIREEARGNVCLLTVSGRLDSSSAASLEAVLPARIQTHERVLLDLSGVAYVSSAGLRVFLIGAKAARAAGHRLALAGLSDSVREVFDISGFTALFTLAPDVDAAISALG